MNIKCDNGIVIELVLFYYPITILHYYFLKHLSVNTISLQVR